MREERKVVTALFADLVGSTALAESLDPEEVKLIVGEAVARIVNAVEDFGGTVKDLAGAGGVLVGAETKRLAEVLFEWGEEQRLELKGKAEPFEAFAAVGALAEPGRQRGMPGLQTKLVGRDRELARANEAVEGALRGAG